MKHAKSRRQFLASAGALASGLLLSKTQLAAPFYIPDLLKKSGVAGRVQLGVITYSFRDMPDQSAEATLQYILDSGVRSVELMGDPAERFAGAPKNPVNFQEVFPLMRKRFEKQTLTEAEQKQLAEVDGQMKAYREELSKWRLTAPMDKFSELKKMYSSAGVEIYAFKPDAFGIRASDAEIAYGMKAARLLGASHVTLEHPGNDAQTLKLGQMAEQQGIKVGYHGHEQQRPDFWNTALAQSPANGLNMDLGHFVAAGNSDPLGMVREKHDRILSMHIKDRQTPAHGKGNLPWGQGDTPIKEALQLMRDQQYRFPATIELEYQVPAGSNAVAEVKKCHEFCKAALG